MKTFVGILVGLTSALLIATLGLALTGHLAIAPHHVLTNVVDDAGQTLFQLSDVVDYYRIIFVK